MITDKKHEPLHALQDKTAACMGSDTGFVVVVFSVVTQAILRTGAEVVLPRSLSQVPPTKNIYMKPNIKLLQRPMIPKKNKKKNCCCLFIIVKEGTVQNKVMSARKDKTGTVSIAKAS